MNLKSRLERIEAKIGGSGVIPVNERTHVIIDDGTIDVDAEEKAIEARFMEKYGTIDGLLIIRVVFDKAKESLVESRYPIERGLDIGDGM